ncbi:hypothetical protein EDB81DRAFT_734678 [Dactylonectria macrodidyma]|uniref:Uncharacterized protein n=1 Tax=Dactylonectria macrodidyma TaxID=307937 RepID=A0A9P9IAF1_9HYPO|nr:hypothetical protein EDB81DRAFT_734678 [Dactylonectria macrodidyma]
MPLEQDESESGNLRSAYVRWCGSIELSASLNRTQRTSYPPLSLIKYISLRPLRAIYRGRLVYRPLNVRTRLSPFPPKV